MKRLWLFTFLHCPGLDATNNAAERAIRGMVITRKVWGGNRTWGDAFTRCVRLLRAPRTVILNIVPGAG
jgi:Transposase IS66 family